MCQRNTQLQSGLIFAWMLPRARLYTLFKAHGPVHSVVCWHLLVAPHIASPLERMSQAAQARAVAFAVSFETTNGQTHTIAVRFSLFPSRPSFIPVGRSYQPQQFARSLLLRAPRVASAALGRRRHECRECPHPLCFPALLRYPVRRHRSSACAMACTPKCFQQML